MYGMTFLKWSFLSSHKNWSTCLQFTHVYMYGLLGMLFVHCIFTINSNLDLLLTLFFIFTNTNLSSTICCQNGRLFTINSNEQIVVNFNLDTLLTLLLYSLIPVCHLRFVVKIL